MTDTIKIGLTYTGNPEKHQYYVEWLKGKDDIKIVKLSADDDNLDLIDSCHALVLSGGIDIHPEFYHQKADYENVPEKFNERRDAFEIAAFHTAQKNNIPVLGICRGMQMINIIHKGSLVRDLDKKNKVHMRDSDQDKRHQVNIESGTLLHDMTGAIRGEVNSAHHQAIGDLGEGLVINAISDDGTIEGLERAAGSDKPFLLGIQWHPERMFRFQLENSPLSKIIRDRFLEQVNLSKAKK
jgi:putative glutamine amidotransferase